MENDITYSADVEMLFNGTVVRNCRNCNEPFNAYNRNRFYCAQKFGKRNYCKTEEKKNQQRLKRNGVKQTIRKLKRSPLYEYIERPTEAMLKIEQLLAGRKKITITQSKFEKLGITDKDFTCRHEIATNKGYVNFIGFYLIIKVSDLAVLIFTP